MIGDVSKTLENYGSHFLNNTVVAFHVPMYVCLKCNTKKSCKVIVVNFLLPDVVLLFGTKCLFPGTLFKEILGNWADHSEPEN